jgi:hypothetical protein
MIKYIFKDFDTDPAYTFFSYQLSNFDCVDITIVFTNDLPQISIEFDMYQVPTTHYNKLTDNVKVDR